MSAQKGHFSAILIRYKQKWDNNRINKYRNKIWKWWTKTRD